ncbi:MAG TPA: 2-amino-4-hydroxy-6-hydroxymethyldihydropteridine diphosphokinase [Burkholderiales bacterium]|nr:2-amino-4-hydroxy-6-hydroxymethyldihydropteridine diphosphokinase [Burkholderiales bacterium]
MSGSEPVALQPAYIALGANLGRPEEQVRAAFEELAMLPNTRLNAVSALYRSAPVGHVDQPDFVNAVAAVETALTARELLDALLEIERRYGRVRDFPNAPRTLDLDIVLYGDAVVNEPGLTIPHPRMGERAFVLVPLAEIAPDAIVPGAGRVADLAARADAASLAKTES